MAKAKPEAYGHLLTSKCPTDHLGLCGFGLPSSLVIL